MLKIVLAILLFSGVAYASEVELKEIERQKNEVMKDAQIAELMRQNAQMRWDKLVQQEEALKQTLEKEKAKK